MHADYKPTSSAPVSHWWTTQSYQPNPKLQGELNVDVAIVGGGFTGLSTAYHLKKAQPGLEVAILEQAAVGFGASGRNAGFGMTLFGLSLSMTKFRFGAERTRQAHSYMEKAVDLLWSMIGDLSLACEAEKNGFIRVATTPASLKRIHDEFKMAQSLGFSGIEWLDSAETQARVQSESFMGGWWEPRCVLLNPLKLALEMKRVTQNMGVKIFEQTPVASITKTAHDYELCSSGGRVRAKKIVLATNAYSNAIPMIRSKQTPAFTHVVVTEPLGDRLEKLGWKGREGLEDGRNLIHYFRLTQDNRLLIGGGDVGVSFNSSLNHDHNQAAFAHLERFIAQLFPPLKGVDISYRWGGPVSVTVDMAPALGFVGRDRSAVYSVGCIGHGVSMSQMNGWTLADLLLELKTERTESFFVNRFTIPWPSEPIRFLLGKAIRQYMRCEDRLQERGHFDY